MHALIVNVFAEPDARLLDINLSPQPIAPSLGLEFLFDCHARPSRLLLSGDRRIRSGICS